MGQIMEIPGYSIDINKAVQSIKKNNYKRVALQIPEGLKQSALKIVDFIQKETNCEIVVIADPCYGACDLANHKLENLSVECVIHIGHLNIPECEDIVIPTLYINAESTLDVSKIILKALPLLSGKNIGLVTTAQHIHTLSIVENILRENDFKPFIGIGDNRIAKDGQILGCNFSSGKSIADKVDSYLYIGSGMFHPVGLLLTTKKPVIVADPYTFKVKTEELENLKETIQRQRYGAIASSQHAKKIGILIGLKPGQQRLQQATALKELLIKHNRQPYILILEVFTPESLQSFNELDCFVSTSCPRIAIDDYIQYKKPIITPVELEIALGLKKWDDYQFDEIM